MERFWWAPGIYPDQIKTVGDEDRVPCSPEHPLNWWGGQWTLRFLGFRQEQQHGGAQSGVQGPTLG